jgi:hypothetical protein
MSLPNISTIEAPVSVTPPKIYIVKNLYIVLKKKNNYNNITTNNDFNFQKCKKYLNFPQNESAKIAPINGHINVRHIKLWYMIIV